MDPAVLSLYKYFKHKANCYGIKSFSRLDQIACDHDTVDDVAYLHAYFMAVSKTGYTSHSVHDDMLFGENVLAYFTMVVH
jgi:hypothetical protein